MRFLKFLTIIFLIGQYDNSYCQIDSILVKYIDSLATADQHWRHLLRKVDNGEVDSIPRQIASHKMRQTDSSNYYHLSEIIEEVGYPGIDVIGEEGSHKFWLLVQHQDLKVDFQEKVLTLMKTEVERNNASASDYAYLIDRVAVNQGKKQTFGTQMMLNPDSTSYIPKPVIDPENLNKRRLEIGLPSIEFYIDVMNKRYFGTLKE